MKRSIPLLVVTSSLLAGLLLIVSVLYAQEPVEESVLCSRSGLDAYCTPRPLNVDDDLSERLQQVLEALIAGPTSTEQAANVWSAIPEGARLDEVAVEGSRVSVYLVLPETYLRTEFNPLLSDQLVEQIAKTIRPFRSELMAAARIESGSPDDRLILHILAQDPYDPAHPFRDLSTFLFEPPLERKDGGRSMETGVPGGEGRPSSLAEGFLNGKAIYLGAGNGWYWNGDSDEWLTQISIWEELVSDFNSAEVVNQYLLPYLTNAGADVWSVRERDLNTQEIIVTMDAPGYSQTGEWMEPTQPVTGSSLIFPWRYAPISETVTASATWFFTPTETVRSSVYVWYADGQDRAPDARYRIEHAGGSSERQVDQTVHGLTWRYLGDYPFYANQPASVTLENVSAVPGRIVSAGAVRIGGGMGSELGGGDLPSTNSSGRPRWEEGARYWVKFQGAPPSVYNPSINDLFDDVLARPRYAEWEKAADEDAIFISWHTNGSLNHESRGTESYIYDGTYGGIWTPGSDLLQYFLHRTLVDDIRAGWNPDWADGGMLADNFGEVRLLETMPGVIMEIAHHDVPEEAKALLDPRFAQLSARAIYRGIVRYFAHRDGVSPVYLPEPPAGLAVRNSGSGEVTLTWLPSPTDGDGPLGDEATSYRVYTSSDGFAWHEGTTVSGTSYVATGLASGQLLFVRVTGINSGGESLPSPTLGARAAGEGRPPVLLVEAFGRNDRSFTTWQDDGVTIEDTDETGPSRRLFADRTNRRDYTIQHGTAISRSFDSATRNMLHAADDKTPPPLDLNRYAIVDWMSGEESSPEEPIPTGVEDIALSEAEQELLAAFMVRGGSLFISGSEIGLDLVLRDKGPSFYREVLNAYYQGSNAFRQNTLPYPNTVLPAPGGLFAGLDGFRFDDGTHGTYDANRVDYFLPLPEDSRSQSTLLYQAGIGHAGLSWDSDGCSRLIYFAIPFETIYPAEIRQAVMSQVMDYLSSCELRQEIYLPLVLP